MSVKISDRDLDVLVSRLPLVLDSLPRTADAAYENAKRLLRLTLTRLNRKQKTRK